MARPQSDICSRWPDRSGSMAAGRAGYGVGRCLGKSTARRLLGNRDYEKGGILFSKRGVWVVVLSANPHGPSALG
jgi:membrane protein YqaA with SNARE-associated domain